ncbi:esterase-like activity of phytase family protein [Pukyongiella litopenaei]|uniref:Esterase-like activity of phytase family protein n=1 Tax=Pukyongiella litopenaei TaxID=2605946 RepID=A0A2S0MSV3_9RHOB|nr:esterase-like activity of phytase family protein [Pukyongiella litopenaei]AVO38946.1 esterase-like activity of phytase family protein [Pukyongiella litopenaei]
MRFGPAIAIAAWAALTPVLPAPAAPASAAEGPPAQFLGEYEWRMDARWFGGFSALALSPDGGAMLVMSDRGLVFHAAILRDGDRIVGIRPAKPGRLRSSEGKRLQGRAGDSEGLAIMPDGTFCVSFEAVTRVSCFAYPGANAVPLRRLPAFRDMPRNGGFEALAVDRRGRLYTMPEDKLDADGNIPVYRWDNGTWSQPFALPSRGRFLPVGADFGPDGRLYLLERSVSPLGFRSRLRRWDVDEDGPKGERVLLQTGDHDNLEGLSVWRDGDGRLRATMISDDNFMLFQRTELVEYTLPD